jgi:hypothetical protein
MPKRTSSKQKPNGEAVSERSETVAREAESSPVLDADIKSVERPQNAMPLLKADTREKRLYKIASMGTPLGSDFFDEFPDKQEILELSLSISTRLLIVAICNSELAPTQRISAMRLVAALNGKQLPANEEDTTANRPTPLTIPAVRMDESAQRSVDKIREISAGNWPTVP